MATQTLTPDEEAQLQQTIEMFEVIVQSQPNDCQSLEILKEAYTKLGREEDVISTSKRIAQAYMQTGQLSSAILEFETVLQRRPDDADVQRRSRKSRTRPSNAATQSAGAEPAALATPSRNAEGRRKKIARGRREIRTMDARYCTKFLWKAKPSAREILICAGARQDLTAAPTDVVEPFIHTLWQKKVFCPWRNRSNCCRTNRAWHFCRWINTTWTLT